MDGSRARLVRALTFLCRARKGLQEAGREVCRGQAEPWQCSPFCPGAQRSSVALAGGHPTPSPTSDGCSEPLQPCQAGKMRGVAMAMPGLEGPSCLRKGSRGCPSRLTVGTADFRQHSGDQPRPPPPCPSASVPCHSATCSPPAPPPAQAAGMWEAGWGDLERLWQCLVILACMFSKGGTAQKSPRLWCLWWGGPKWVRTGLGPKWVRAGPALLCVGTAAPSLSPSSVSCLISNPIAPNPTESIRRKAWLSV